MTPLMALKDIVSTEGVEIIQNPQKCLAMLKDLCNSDKYIQDINILAISLKNNMPQVLLDRKEYDHNLSKRLATKLYDNFGIREDIAGNAINVWSQVLYSKHTEKEISVNTPSAVVGLKILTQQELKKIVQNAQSSDAQSLNELGKIYLEGIYTNKNEQKAFSLFNKASEKGLSLADNNLGCCYEYGIGTVINHSLAFEHYYKASQDKLVQAEFNVGRCYEEGIGVAKDLNLAKDFFLKSSLKHDAESQYRLATLNYNLATKPSDTYMQQAFTWFLSGANLNHALSQYNVAKCYELGLGVNADINSAVTWYKKALKNGETQAEIDLKKISFASKGAIDIFS